jgi:hypothetical protein
LTIKSSYKKLRPANGVFEKKNSFKFNIKAKQDQKIQFNVLTNLSKETKELKEINTSPKVHEVEKIWTVKSKFNHQKNTNIYIQEKNKLDLENSFHSNISSPQQFKSLKASDLSSKPKNCSKTKIVNMSKVHTPR